MANLLQKTVQRSTFPTISLDQWVSFFSFNGLQYPSGLSQTISGHEEVADYSYEGLVFSAYKSNGVVFACMLARQLAFSEARFQFLERNNGRPGRLFGTSALEVLEHPWPGGVTADLLSRAMQDVDLAGNFFAVRRANRIRRLRPDWVTIILGSEDGTADQEAGDIDAEVVGYMYHPGGYHSQRDPVFLLREQVAHWAPVPDPAASYRGMSWLIPVVREFMSDTSMMVHKQKFFENGATPNMVVTLDPSIKKESFKEWVKMFSDKHEGALNAYKTLYLGGGSTVLPVGKDFKQMDFAITQAAGETRIAAAAGVPPVIVGLSEGLKAATYSNYSQARRRFADMTMRPLWRSAATSFGNIVPAPGRSELWYDDRDIPFLIEDFKDRAEVQAHNAAAIRQLIDGGFDPKSVVDAVTADDLTRLVHTGLVSVQLQPPGTINSGGNNGGTVPKNVTPADKPAKPVKDELPKGDKKTKVNSKNDGASAADLLMRMAELRAQEAQQAPASVEVHLHEGMVRSETPVSVNTTIEEGAFRADAPQVHVDAPVSIEDGAIRMEIAEGAIRGGDVDVTVEPPEFELRDGAIHVLTSIERGAIQVDAPVTVERTEVHIDEGAVQVDSPVTIERGAVQVDAPVTVERSETHIDAGAVQVSAPVTVERTEVHVDPGAVQIDAPVTVERTEVTIAEGALRVDAPITVERSDVHVDPGAVQVSVERTEVHIDEGAVRVDANTTIEEGAIRMDAPITVETPEVRVESPVTVQPANVEVRIEEGAVKVDAPVTLSEGAVRVDAPVTMERGAVEVQVDSPVQIAEGAVHVDAPVTIERGAVEVQVEAPEVDVTVEAPEVKRGRVVRETEFRTDDEGKIVGKREVETDE